MLSATEGQAKALAMLQQPGAPNERGGELAKRWGAVTVTALRRAGCGTAAALLARSAYVSTMGAAAAASGSSQHHRTTEWVHRTYYSRPLGVAETQQKAGKGKKS